MLQARRLVEEMPTTSTPYRLSSSTSLCLFPLSEVMFQFPITILFQDCILLVVFNSTRENACAVPIHLPDARRAQSGICTYGWLARDCR